MVSANLKGGLGNYMFQIATAHTLAVRNNDIAKFNFASAMQVHKNVEHYKSNIFRNVISGECELFWQWDEPTFTFNEIPYKNGLLLNGYFQSEKYLDRDETLKLFEIPDHIIKTLKEIENLVHKIRETFRLNFLMELTYTHSFHLSK